MMNYKVLNSRERKKIWQQINNQFSSDISEDKAILQNKDKIYLVNEELHDLPDIKVYYAGMYFCKVMNEGLRPTIEGAQLISKTAKSNFLDLDNSQINLWIKGYDLDDIKVEDGFYLIRNNNDVFGCGKIKSGKLFNYVPKGRRLVNIHE